MNMDIIGALAAIGMLALAGFCGVMFAILEQAWWEEEEEKKHGTHRR